MTNSMFFYLFCEQTVYEQENIFILLFFQMILSKQSERAAHRANHTENHRKQIVNNSVLRLDKSGMFKKNLKKILKKSLVSQSLVNPEIRPSSRSGMLNVNAYAGALRHIQILSWTL